MAYEGSWDSFGRDFTPTGSVKMADSPEPEPQTLSLEAVLVERLRKEGRLEEFREKTGGFKVDGPIESQDVQDLATTVEKIGVAVEHREQADQALVERFERAASHLQERSP